MSIDLPLGSQHIAAAGHILIEVTKRCHNRCRHCFTNASPTARQAQPTPAQLKTLFRSIEQLGFKAITISGGEPLLRKEIDTIVANVPKGLAAWIFTSGLGMDLSRLRRWGYGIEGFAVSIDGTPQQHNALRQSRRSFQETLGFIKLCAVSGVRMQLQSMVLRDKMEHLPMVIELAEVTGVERILFSHISPDGRGATLHAEQMDVAGLDALQRRINKLQQHTPVTLRTNLMKKSEVSKRFPPATLHIIPTGEVLPWYGVPSSFALGSLEKYSWDLGLLLKQSKMASTTNARFSVARQLSEQYSGRYVPVDDLLVQAFREAALCA